MRTLPLPGLGHALLGSARRQRFPSIVDNDNLESYERDKGAASASRCPGDKHSSSLGTFSLRYWQGSTESDRTTSTDMQEVSPCPGCALESSVAFWKKGPPPRCLTNCRCRLRDSFHALSAGEVALRALTGLMTPSTLRPWSSSSVWRYWLTTHLHEH
jgi:hypothetical protein